MAALPFLVRLLHRAVHSFITPAYQVHDRGIVLITGTSTGIGNATVFDLLEKTQYTVFAGVRSTKDYDTWKAMQKDRIVPVLLDVTNSASISNVVKLIKEYVSKHNIPLISVINNAGTSYSAPFEYHPVSNMRQTFEVNILGVMEVTQQFLPLLKHSQGRLILVSSVAGMVCRQLRSVYCATKFAMEGWADGLRRELYRTVSVSLIQPGLVRSTMANQQSEMSVKMLLEHQVNITEAREVYSRFYSEAAGNKMQHIIETQAGDPHQVSGVILEALNSVKPYPRYRVAGMLGVPAWLAAWLVWLVPDFIQDALFG